MKKVNVRVPRMLAAGATLAAALLLNAPAHAQYQQQDQGGRGRWEQGRRQDPGQRLDRQVQMLTQRLNLSSSQATQVRRILEQQDRQFQAYRQSNGGQDGWQRNGRRDGRQGGWQRQPGQGGGQAQGQRRQLPPELQAIRDRTEQQIERVLNDGQRAQYRQLREQRGQWGSHERGEGRGQRGGQDGQYRGSR